MWGLLEASGQQPRSSASRLSSSHYRSITGSETQHRTHLTTPSGQARRRTRLRTRGITGMKQAGQVKKETLARECLLQESYKKQNSRATCTQEARIGRVQYPGKGCKNLSTNLGIHGNESSDAGRVFVINKTVIPSSRTQTNVRKRTSHHACISSLRCLRPCHL